MNVGLVAVLHAAAGRNDGDHAPPVCRKHRLAANPNPVGVRILQVPGTRYPLHGIGGFLPSRAPSFQGRDALGDLRNLETVRRVDGATADVGSGAAVGRRDGRRQGVPQRRDAGGSRRGRCSKPRIGTGARPAPLAGQEDGRDAAGEASCAESVVCKPPACARAAGSPPATPPGRDGGTYSRAHVWDGRYASGVGARSRECPQARAAPGGRLQHRAAVAPPDRRRYAPEPAGAGCFGDFPPDRVSDRLLGASEATLGVQMDTDGARRLNRLSPSCLNSGRSANRLLPRAATRADATEAEPRTSLVSIWKIRRKSGAGERTRTADLLITKQPRGKAARAS